MNNDLMANVLMLLGQMMIQNGTTQTTGLVKSPAPTQTQTTGLVQSPAPAQTTGLVQSPAPTQTQGGVTLSDVIQLMQLNNLMSNSGKQQTAENVDTVTASVINPPGFQIPPFGQEVNGGKLSNGEQPYDIYANFRNS